MIIQIHLLYHYCISLVIRDLFFSQYNPKNLDLSYKTDLDLWDCFGRITLVFIVIAKFHRADLDIWGQSREGKPLSNCQINTC